MKTQAHHKIQPRGFALVVTVSLMVLLAVICVGLLGLSAVSLRSSTQTQAQAQAQANARLALMIAIGELQRHTGSDTRVTASAEIANQDYPPLLGVWKSWEGTNHAANGRPIAPNYGVKGQPAADGGRFVHWLVSSAGNMDNPGIEAAPALVDMVAREGTVPLLADGTLSSTDSRQVHVVPTRLENNGRIAWWISGENQKARLAQPHEPRTDDVAGWVEMGQSHTIPNPEGFGLATLLIDPEAHHPNGAPAKPARKAVSRQTMALIEPGNPVEPHKKFHDLTTNSVGLLTNTATGGWRKDLSLLTEKWDDIYADYPGGLLPLFRYSPDPGDTSKVPKPTPGNYSPPQVSLYPWSEYSTIIGSRHPNTYFAASASWSSLRSFATLYKNFAFESGTARSPFIWNRIIRWKGNPTGQMFYDYHHEQRLFTQIARFQLLVYARIPPDIEKPKGNDIRLKYVPIFTLWNPYNVALDLTISGTLNAGQWSGKEVNFRGFGWRRSLPAAMAIVPQRSYASPEAVPSGQYRLLTGGNLQYLDRPNKNYGSSDYDSAIGGNVSKYGNKSTWIEARARAFGCWLPEGTISFEPGEAKVFSPNIVSYAYGYSTASLLKEGYDGSNAAGLEFASNAGSHIKHDDSVWFLLRPDRLTRPYLDRQPGLGFSLSFGDGADHFGGSSAFLPSGIGSEFHNITALANESEGMKYWPPDEVDEVPYSMAELQSGPWLPVFSISFGPRMTIGTGPGTNQNRPTKGLVQNDALASMVLSDPASGDGKDHPVNNTFDFAYHSLSIGSTITPNLSASEGFIATGHQSGDGLTRLIMSEIPLRPMASLVELQGWNPRGNNPYPPFQMNLIGNSDATPLIPKDDIVPSTLNPSGVALNLQHDDAYCANHLLFDDWFVSSIAPQPYELGGTIAKNIETFYRDFLTGDDELTNRSYRTIPEDSSLSLSEAQDLAQEMLNRPDGWLKIASRLEVEGMFNVNSTSVEAWKALLGQARSRERIAMHGENGIVAADAPDGLVVTRGAVATDVEAGPATGFGAKFANASEYTGFRSLSDGQIEDLAEKVVEQVRLRGPFLSLSEFVNRQLSNDGDLALAGAIQSALNDMKEDPMAELRKPANSLAENTMDEKDPKLDGADYQFPEAAKGSSAHGVPGWIRQADVLRPIAPVLSVRDDTFTIRAYGEHLDSNGRVSARAWCEAVVKRTRDFYDSSDAADSADPPADEANETFGRRYRIVSFRWLHSDEV